MNRPLIIHFQKPNSAHVACGPRALVSERKIAATVEDVTCHKCKRHWTYLAAYAEQEEKTQN